MLMVCVYIYMYVYIHIYVCVYVYIYIYIYMASHRDPFPTTANMEIPHGKLSKGDVLRAQNPVDTDP